MNNGYTQIEIDGQTIGIKFGLPCLQMLAQKTAEPSLFSGTNVSDIRDSAYLLYYGYINNCMVKEAVPVHKFEFFMDYVESAVYDVTLSAVLMETITIFKDSKFVIGLTEKKAEPDVKKKNGSLKKSKPIAMAH